VAGILAAAYPAVWLQLVTAALSHKMGRKLLICSSKARHSLDDRRGRLRQLAHRRGPARRRNTNGLPCPARAIGDITHSAWRARSVGIYRLWRDGGFTAGALLSGLLADAYGIPAAAIAVAAVTTASRVLVAARMPGTDHNRSVRTASSSSTSDTPESGHR